MSSVDAMLEMVAAPRGCKVSHIEIKDAIKFVEGVTKLKQEGKEPNVALASSLLQKKWGISIDRRALTAHARGECSCPKT